MKWVQMISRRERVRSLAQTSGVDKEGICETETIPSISSHPGKTSRRLGPQPERSGLGSGFPQTGEGRLRTAKMVQTSTRRLPPCGQTWELLSNSFSPILGSEHLWEGTR